MRKMVAWLAAVTLIVSLSAASAHAQSVNETDGVGIKGYDPVSYFTDNKPVIGTTAYTYVYEGITYRFASAAHRNMFLADPTKYLPQFGGFCAFGAANGHKADVDPIAFTIVDGKLYLNHSVAVRTLWQHNEPGYIDKAEKQWPTVSRQSDVIH